MDYERPIITINDIKNNETVGEFYVENGMLTFKGKADESAKIFFDSIISNFNEYIEEERKKVYRKVLKTWEETTFEDWDLYIGDLIKKYGLESEG